MAAERRFHILTLGCKINQYESQALKEAWLRKGLLWVDRPGEAEVVLINSCAVTEGAVQDVRKAARRVHRNNPRARIVITGCAVPRAKEDLTNLPSQAVFVQQADKPLLQHDPELGWPSPELRESHPGAQKAKRFPELQISAFPRARPVLKIQDGCSQGCSYCIVPLTRGPSRSRPPQEILAEANRLLQAGYSELVLSGINLGQYAVASQGMEDFWDLLPWLEARLEVSHSGRIRLRISSLEPSLLQAKGLQALRRSRLVCPHLHVSLQSASPEVLRRMGRDPRSADLISEFVGELRQSWPLFGLGADILVGFPGETEADFERTVAFCRSQPLSYGHVFVFSPRPGTRAQQMSGQLDSGLKKERSRIIRELLQKKREAFLHRLAGESRLSVVLEDTDPAVGLCEHYAVCRFEEPLQGGQPSDLVEAKPVRPSNGGLLVSFAGGKAD